MDSGSDAHSGPRGKPYTVRGKTYRPLLSADGFREVGVASWYGPGFHGKKTANGERYNMYAMTAAHKLLPLGSSVRVTHLSNGRSIVVRVNDRGPFIEDRIIDLSYTAAQRLNIIGTGTARVRVESLEGQRPSQGGAASDDMEGDFYIQVAALGARSGAAALVRSLQAGNFGGRSLFAPSLNLWRVQAGPFPSLRKAEEAVSRLKSRFPGCYVVSD